MKAYTKQCIGGVWKDGSGESLLQDVDPYSGEILFSYRSASMKDVDEAYEAAKASQTEWQAVTPSKKSALFDNLASVIDEYTEVIADCVVHEAGGLRRKGMMEAKKCRDFACHARHYPYEMTGNIIPSDISGKDNYVFKLPKGVISVIAPWNVPFVLAMRSVIPAIATGNGVVLKPSSDTPASAFIIAEMIEKAGFPKGLVNAIAGRGSEIGDYILEHPIPTHISFTGSTEVGRHVGALAGKHVKGVSLELGGNNPMIVLKDADIERAVSAAVHGSYSNQGQICMAINRIIVDSSIYDEFLEAFVALAKKQIVGNPADSCTDIGPVINARHAAKINDYVNRSIAAGAKVSLEGKTEGNIIYPWVLSDCTNNTPACCNEVFGPVACVMKAKNEQEALKVANDTEYGLVASVFSRDRYHAIEVAKQIVSGMVHINDQPMNDECQVMFGGEKQSGVGRFNDRWIIDHFTTDKWVSVQNLRPCKNAKCDNS